nr:MAG TPA: hypothetical protein [Caudoviricetes sp.]
MLYPFARTLSNFFMHIYILFTFISLLAYTMHYLKTKKAVNMIALFCLFVCFILLIVLNNHL